MDKEQQTNEAKPGYVFALNADIGNGRNFQVTGNFPKGVGLAEVEKDLNLFCKAIDRKQTEAAVPALEAEIEQFEANIAAQERDIAAIDKRNEGKPTPTQEKLARENALVNINALKEKTARKKEFLTKLKESID